MAELSVDLLALVRPEIVTVTVAGHPFALTASTASNWLGAIAMDPQGLYGIVPGLIADDDLDLMESLWQADPDIGTRWFYAARTALGRAAGRDWWWAQHLAVKSLQSWPYVNGTLLRQNINAKHLSLPDWLDACYMTMWSNADEENRIKLDFELNMRPQGIPTSNNRAAQRRMALDFAAD